MYKIILDNKVIATTENIAYIKKHPTEDCYVPAEKSDATGVAVQSLGQQFALMGHELDGLPQVVVVESDGGTELDKSTSLSSLVFVAESQKDNSVFDDVTILEHSELFPPWDENWTGKRGTIMQDDSILYRSLHDIGVGQNQKPSENNGSLWQRIGNPWEEYPEWSPFLGVGDAYRLGDKVTHDGKRWVCTAVGGDGIWNIWEPGVYGWTEVTE